MLQIKRIYIITIIALLNIIFAAFAEPNQVNKLDKLDKLDYQQIELIPVLHEGRIKPLDSYARILLKSIANKEAINNKSATQWLILLLINPKQDYNNSIFYIHNQDVQSTLGLKKKNSSYYSFTEILPGIKQNISLINHLETVSRDKTAILSPAEQQLLDLYHKTLIYFDTSRTLSLFLPEFDLKHIKQSLNIDINHIKNNVIYNNKINYYQVLPYKNIIASYVNNILNTTSNIEKITKLKDQQVLGLAKQFKDTANDRININLKIIPDNNTDNNWLAPWEAITNISGTIINTKYLDLWQKLIYSYYNNNSQDWKKYSLELNQLSNNHQNISSKLHAEILFNKLKPFNKSIILYFVALILVIYILIKNTEVYNIKNKILYFMSFTVFIAATLCHISGLIMRIYILARPPVSNLYESILFVGVIIALFSLFIEFFRKDQIGILIGSIICTILQFIANSYATTGDTLGVLIAVLDNNFWLGTHVIAITSGYGCCLLTSALAHIYLFKFAYNKKEQHNHVIKQSLLQLNKYILAFSLLSLFFTLLGTILGGIWADQSWGRFWGWDPKENGALLICLWLIALLHGRISGHLNNLRFITGCALTSITVMLAWFGVNVLGTGLHSYGFTENIVTNLLLFIVLELILILGLYIIGNLRLERNHAN